MSNALNLRHRLFIQNSDQTYTDLLLNAVLDEENVVISCVGNNVTTQWDMSKNPPCVIKHSVFAPRTRAIHFIKKLSSGVVLSRFGVHTDVNKEIILDSTLSPFHCYRNGVCFESIPAHKGNCTSCVEMEDGNFVTSSTDCTIKVWDVDFACIKVAKSEMSFQRHVKLRRDLILSAHDGEVCYVWSYPDLKIVSKLDLSNRIQMIWDIAVFEDLVAISGAGGALLLYRVLSATTIVFWKRLIPHGISQEVRSVAFLPNGFLVSGDMNGMVNIWNPETSEVVSKMDTKENVRFIRISKDRQVMFLGGGLGIYIYDIPLFCVRLHFSKPFHYLTDLNNMNFHFD